MAATSRGSSARAATPPTWQAALACEGPPPGPNLTTIPQWVTADEFVTLLRTGRFPDGRLIGPNMPIKYLEKMSDDDIRAIYAYLRQGGVLPDNK